MDIRLNGDMHVFTDGATIQDVLDTLGLDSARVAVERNGEIVERERFPACTLSEGDSLEVIRFVGGG